LTTQLNTNLVIKRLKKYLPKENTVTAFCIKRVIVGVNWQVLGARRVANKISEIGLKQTMFQRRQEVNFESIKKTNEQFKRLNSYCQPSGIFFTAGL